MQYHPLANIFPLLEGALFDALVADIKANGVLDPLMMFEDMLLDGRNRWRAAEAAGVTITGKDIKQFDPKMDGDPLDWVISKNLHRRHLDESQRAMVAAKLATMPHGGDRTKSPIGDLKQADAAAMLNVGKRSVERAGIVVDDGVPDLVRAVEQGRVAVSAASELATVTYWRQRQILAKLPRSTDGKLTPDAKKALAPYIREIRAEKVAQKKEQRGIREAKLGAAQLAWPSKRYGVILADPEWHFHVGSDAGMLSHPANHYPTSDIETIKARDVSGISADDCVLFLWSTVPMQVQAFQVMNAWGFNYVSGCVWVKDRCGTGYWFRNQHELLLVGTKGKIPAPAAGTQWPSVIVAPVGRHSAKPEKFLEMIEDYYPTVPKIELNRRGPARVGWDAWGDEVDLKLPDARRFMVNR